MSRLQLSWICKQYEGASIRSQAFVDLPVYLLRILNFSSVKYAITLSYDFPIHREVLSLFCTLCFIITGNIHLPIKAIVMLTDDLAVWVLVSFKHIIIRKNYITDFSVETRISVVLKVFFGHIVRMLVVAL